MVVQAFYPAQTTVSVDRKVARNPLLHIASNVRRNIKIKNTKDNMKTFLTIILTSFLGLTAFSTAQISDKIIYKGKTYKLHCNPLESYFNKNPDKRPKSEIMSTALWRGYVATFKIKNKQLFLKDIKVMVSGKNSYKKWKSVIKEVFPNQKEIKIDWFTGLLVLPYGKRINYVHMGYGSTYENYILIELDNGNFNKEKKFDYNKYEEFKEKQFQAFKKTDEYNKIKKEIQKETDSDEFIDTFLKDFVINYTTKILTDE
ncbi:MAG: hypothetical protein UR43_C0010G0025 [candidate division TM6 bacterium GW2011_GWF2_33_332]|nr:MAG: hypothetical protein UR43_C0010G0025 [candidate division TM6 bacterium GW2011_GWF2_33_332]